MLLVFNSNVWVVVLVGMITLVLFAIVLLITVVAFQKKFAVLYRESELRMHKGEQPFRHLVEGSPLAILVSVKDRIVYANAAAVSLFGARTITDLKGRQMHSFFTLSAPGTTVGIPAPSSGDTLPNVIYRRLQRFDGILIDVETIATPVSYEGQEARHMIVTDISDKVEIEERLRDIPKRILEAQERERRRVAQDLHDGVNQILRSIRFRLVESVQYVRAPENVMNEISQIGVDLEEAADEINRISHNLLPSQLEHLGLLPAIRSLGTDFSKRTGIAVRYRFVGMPERIDREIELTIFRIVQECLNNVDKHSRADAVDIELDKDENTVLAVVRDNGNGFTNMSLATAKGTPLGIGINTMKERAAFHHGNISIESAPFEGTKVVVTIPLLESIRPHTKEDLAAYAA